MTEYIIDNNRIIEKEKKIFKNIIIIIFLISVIFVCRIFTKRDIDKPYLESTLFFIRTFNFLLALLGSGSCIFSYIRLRKDSVFIISLVYLGLSVDILFGNIDYITFYNEAFSLPNYINISTSILGVVLLYLGLKQNCKLKELIIKNKEKSIVFVIFYTIIASTMEKNLNITYNIKFLILYNLFLIISYMIGSINLFIKGIKIKEYLFIVLSFSIMMLSIKGMHALYIYNTESFYRKLMSVGITYFASLIVIGGTFIELFLYINRTKILNENLGIFHNIVDNNRHSYMIICNEDGDTLYANKKVKEHYSNLGVEGMENLDILFKHISDKLGNSNEVMELLNSEGCWRSIITNEFDNMSIDCAMQLLDASAEKKEIAISCMDISEDIKKEVELEKMKVYTRERTEFMSNISHELRTPVNIFYSTIQLLDKILLEEKEDFKLAYEKYKKALHVNSKRILRLINNVVDISKIDTGVLTGDFGTYNIISVVEDVTLSVLDYAKCKSIEIIFDTNCEENITRCDPNLLERAILNLLSNAIKFSYKNSTIYVDMIVSEDYTEISIKDEGIGISNKDKKYIFERFVQADKSLTRKNEGSGIGLSIVKSIVELHGGYISVESEEGKGATFKIILPNKQCNEENCEIYDIDDYNIELELSDIYEVLINKNCTKKASI